MSSLAAVKPKYLPVWRCWAYWLNSNRGGWVIEPGDKLHIGLCAVYGVQNVYRGRVMTNKKQPRLKGL